MALTVADRLNLIDSLDLSLIREKLLDPAGRLRWTQELADDTVRQYRQFLKLCVLHPAEPLVPTEEIDEVWHAHILDTMKYAEDCDAIFGHFIHHVPEYPSQKAASEDRSLDEIHRCHELFLSEFGESPYAMASAEAGGHCSQRGCSNCNKSCYQKCYSKCHSSCSKACQKSCKSGACNKSP